MTSIAMTFGGGILGAFVLGFSALFTIVNPIGNALTFLAATTDRSPDERRALARRIGLYSLAILLASIWFGVHVLAFLGISLGALRVAGGLAVCAQAWTMLLAPDLAQPHFDDRRDLAPLKNDPAFFPLTMPFTAGPGAIAVAITLGAEQSPGHLSQAWMTGGATLAALAIATSVWAIYASADHLAIWLGAPGERVVGRLVAFMLLCVGVQMLWAGVGHLVIDQFPGTVGRP